MPSMHTLGGHSHLFRGPPARVAAAVVRHGLTCVQLTPSFPGLPFHDPGQITAERCRLVSRVFHDAGLRVACVSSGVQLLEPDLDRRHRGILRLHRLIRHGRDFGTTYLSAETGRPDPPDRSSEAWTELNVILE